MSKPADEKKQIPLRLSKSLWQDLVSWADDEFRSVNGQIEYLLTEAVRRRRKVTHADRSFEELDEVEGSEGLESTEG